MTILQKESDDEKETSQQTEPTPTQKKEEQVQEEEETDQEEEAKTTGSDAYESYVIRPGDTLFKISIQRYGDMSEIEEICRLNGISEDDIIYPGQTLLLPE